jgi:NTE family protein
VLRLLLIFLLLVGVGYSKDRPTIGLVLSGGGARGGAHLGVIKMLEKHHIPIDMIVGTSMGAFVGGLYASGKGSLEIEALLTQTQWNKYISSSYNREDIPFRSKQFDHDFPSKLKLGINSKNEVVLQTGLFSRQNMLGLLNSQTYDVRYVDDFDNLLIPFRAVATNIKNGEEVILKHGALSEAIYASIAIPGGFQPIVIDGKTLVDGGISSNLPLEAMRAMNPDIIIVVDISTPFNKDTKIDSYIDVLGQLNNILMRKNVEETIASMRDNEILLTPELGDITPLDADRYPEIIKIGEESVEAIYDEKLSNLSIDDNLYNKYLLAHRTSYHFASPVVDEIVIDNQTKVNNELIYSYIHVKEGETLDLVQLQKDLTDLYNLTLFEDVAYKLDFINHKTVLKILLTPSWNANGILRFGIGFDDDFNSNSNYSLLIEYTMLSINSYGAEWRTRGSIGKTRGVLTEFYQPLNAMREFFIRPYAYYQERKVNVAPNALGISPDTDDSIALDGLTKGGGVGIGYNINSSMQFETGFKAEENELSGDFIFLDVNGSNPSYSHLRGETNSRFFYATIVLDSTDNAFFPTTGNYGRIYWKKEIESIGGELDYSRISVVDEYAYSIGSHTILPKFEYVSTYQGDININSLVTLGGFGRLSGYAENSFSGDSLALVRLNYRYNVYKNAFFGSFTAPLYVGTMLEAGDTWRNSETPFFDDIIFAGNLYVASDTILGPCYLAYGRSQGGHDMFYFSLGSSF